MKPLNLKFLTFLLVFCIFHITGVSSRKKHHSTRVETSTSNAFDIEIIDYFSEGFIVGMFSKILSENQDFPPILFKLLKKDNCKTMGLMIEGKVSALEVDKTMAWTHLEGAENLLTNRDLLDLTNLCADFYVLGDSFKVKNPSKEAKLSKYTPFDDYLQKILTKYIDKKIEPSTSRVANFLLFNEMILDKVAASSKIGDVDFSKVNKNSIDICKTLYNQKIPRFDIFKVMDIFVHVALERLYCTINDEGKEEILNKMRILMSAKSTLAGIEYFTKPVTSNYYFATNQISLFQEISRKFLKEQSKIKQVDFQYFGLVLGEFGAALDMI